MIRDDFQISWKQIVQNVSLSHICTAELAAKFIATLLFQKKGKEARKQWMFNLFIGENNNNNRLRRDVTRKGMMSCLDNDV